MLKKYIKVSKMQYLVLLVKISSKKLSSTLHKIQLILSSKQQKKENLK